MKYNCLIIDDNEIERDLLASYLSISTSFNIIASCESSLAAAKILSDGTQSVDVVFSDIDMPDLSGLDLLKNLKNPPVFVFVTSYPEYALDSINLDALDFIVKPVSLNRLIKTSNKVISYLNLKNSVKIEQQIQSTIENYFFIKDAKGHVKIQFNDVLYIESLGDFSKLYLVAQKEHLVLVNLKNMEQQLPKETFARVHRQFIINLNALTEINGNELVLGNDIKVSLGLAYRKDIIEFINRKTLQRQVKD